MILIKPQPRGPRDKYKLGWLTVKIEDFSSVFMFCSFTAQKPNYFIVHSLFIFFPSIHFSTHPRGPVMTAEDDTKAVKIHQRLKLLCETIRVQFWEQMSRWDLCTKLCQRRGCHIWECAAVLGGFLRSFAGKLASLHAPAAYCVCPRSAQTRAKTSPDSAPSN